MDPRPPSAELRRAGALATGIALALWWVLSAWDEISFAPAALAGALLRAAPGGLATFFIETIGHWARPLLVAGVLLITVAFGAEVLHRTDGRVGPAAALLAIAGGIASFIGPSPGAHPIATAVAVVACA